MTPFYTLYIVDAAVFNMQKYYILAIIQSKSDKN